MTPGLEWGGWFDAYRDRLGPRFPTFKAALGLLLQGGGRRIVETGSVRVPEAEGGWWTDGCSTVLFAEAARRHGLALWTVDADPQATAVALRRTAVSRHVAYVTARSVTWLWDKAPERIDLLYLDSLDCPPDGDATAAQEHQDAELQAAWSRLAPRAVVLLDDNGFANGGKTRIAKGRLARHGWVCVLDDAQSLWVPPPPA